MSPEKENEEINLSLDEYIRRKNINGQFSMLNMRKKDKNIDKEELDASLNKIARKNKIARNKKTGDKFDRFNDDTESESDNDEDENEEIYVRKDNLTLLESDVEMLDSKIAQENSSIRFAQEIQKMDHPDCCKFKEFVTVENKLGVKVQPQQWRLEKQNLERPKGVPRLVAIPLNDEERYKKFKNGRVNKNYKKNDQQQRVKAGIFVEKGNFTYKIDANGDEQNDSENVVGIVRNKPNTKIVSGFRKNNNNNQNQGVILAPPPPVNINMNWESFFNGFANCIKATNPGHFQPHTQPVSSTSSPHHSPTSSEINRSRVQPQFGGSHKKNEELQLKVAANDLLDYLIQKREKERMEQQQAAMLGLQKQLSAFNVNESTNFPATLSKIDLEENSNIRST